VKRADTLDWFERLDALSIANRSKARAPAAFAFVEAMRSRKERLKISFERGGIRPLTHQTSRQKSERGNVMILTTILMLGIVLAMDSPSTCAGIHVADGTAKRRGCGGLAAARNWIPASRNSECGHPCDDDSQRVCDQSKS